MTFINFIIKKSNSKNIIIGIAFILLVNIVIFPFFLSDNVNIGNILDLHFGFSLEDVLNALSEMQKSGRRMYLLTTFLIDTPYAIIYGFIYAIIIVPVLKNKTTKANHYLILTPFLISIFDLLENSGIIYFILNYPNINSVASKYISLFNQLKWISAITILFFVLYLLLRKWIFKYPTYKGYK